MTEPQLKTFKIHCYKCNDTGKIMAMKKDEDAMPYAFRCCYCQLNVDKRYPLWSAEYAKHYEGLK